MSLLDSLLNSILLASLQQQQLQQQQEQQQQLQLQQLQQQQQQLSAVRLCVRRQVHELAVHQYSTSSFCGSSHAYLQAMAVNPALVMSETDPLHFVRYCQYNVWTGTQRLCHYWTERLKLFGPDRAFLPLTLTGHGALSPTDIVTLHAGYPAILPDTVTGQHCVLSDRRKWVPESTVEHKLRAWFYICAVLMNKDDDVDVDDDTTTTITTGSTIRPVLVLVLSATARETTVDWTLVRRISALFATAFPLTPHIHLLNLPHQKRPWIAHQVAQTAIQVFQQFFIGSNIHIQLHSTSSSSSKTSKPNQKKNRVAGSAPLPGTASTALQQDSHTLLTSSSSSSSSLLEQLQALGLTKRGIPVFAGGEWKMEDWYQWCQEREQWEEQRQQQQQQQQQHYNPQQQHPLKNNDDTTTTTNKENQVKNGPITTTNNKRTKVTTATTTITATTTTTTTTTTTQSTTQTPTTATTQTPLITQTLTLLEQKRLAHLLQSRRKRERQREEFRLLQEEAVQLQDDHHRLKREHAQLQQWMQQAQNSNS